MTQYKGVWLILTTVKAGSFLACNSRSIVRSIHANVINNISPKHQDRATAPTLYFCEIVKVSCIYAITLAPSLIWPSGARAYSSIIYWTTADRH